MVRKKVEPQKDIEITSQSKTTSILSSQGEFPCVLIFPDKKHIKNYTFAPIFDFIKQF